jgi:phage tail protein X
MAVTINVILGWCRIAAAHRAEVIAMIMPNGMTDLADFTTDEVKEAAKSFTRLPNNPFMLSPYSIKRMVQLSLWAKDQIRLDATTTLPNGTAQAAFATQLEDAQKREKIRKERQKSAENLASVRIEPPLRTSAGWEAWYVALETALKLAYGSKGVPLAYLLRTTDTPTMVGDTWEEMAINATPLNGLEYEADLLTVHLFILNNVSEESDAYTYIQPLLARNNGRRDVLALKDRYDNEASVQTRVNMANKTWDMLVYKNERAMTFEDFCSKLQRALQHFERAGRAKHEGDVIDWIWSHIQNSELGQTIAALKANQSLAARTPAQILQEIAKEIPNLHRGSSFQARVNEVGKDMDYTFEGDAPASGCLTSDGKLFCGTFDGRQWFGSDITASDRQRIQQIRELHPEHKPVRAGRGGGGGGKGGNPNRRSQERKHNHRIKQLQKLQEKLAVKLSALQTEDLTKDDDEEKPEDNNHAGDSFGGRASMREGKKKPD